MEMISPYLRTRASFAVAGNSSKSVDFSELLRPPHSQPQPRLPRMSSTEKTGWNDETLVECHDDEINGERFGTMLGIHRSVSSPTNHRKGFQLQSKEKVGRYSAVKRVFSMRRSASVSERYCRIDDQYDTPTAYVEGEDSMDEETGSGSPMKPVKQQQRQLQHKGGKIIEACKRFFNLK